jgi:phospholipase C
MPVEHFFVLVLENRSFDHIFGFSRIEGKDAIAGGHTTIDRPDPAVHINTDSRTGKPFPVHEGADFSLKGLDLDPGHEPGDVQQQLTGPNLGFVNNYASQKKPAANPGRVMDCFSAEQLPVLNHLATEFAVCDSWFSSMPGPTWPNRFFMMAASSGGLTKSPSTGDIIKATALKGYSFEGGNIFDALDKAKKPWCIIEGDLFPVSFALKGMNRNSARGRFIDIDSFTTKLNDPEFNENFIFIEPQYGTHKFDITGPGDFSGGDSMHPLDDVRKGEQLVKEVYEAIRSVPSVWESSVLLITFDEHGGFYDHAIPPVATPPGDKPINAAHDQAPFDFAQLGVRVPTIIVSPLIEKGVIDHTVYDHTSGLATMEKFFGLPSLTKRDAAAKDFLHLFTLKEPRSDTPLLLAEPAVAMKVATLTATPKDTLQSLRAELALLERHPTLERMAPEPEVSGPQVGFAFVALMRTTGMVESEAEDKLWKDEFSKIHSRQDAARFMTRAKLKIQFNEFVPPPQAQP